MQNQEEAPERFMSLDTSTLEQQLSGKKKNYHTWTNQEEKLLQEGVTRFGKRWDQISATLLPDLTPGQIKNKYYALQKFSSDSRSDSRSVSQVETSSKSTQQEQKQQKPEDKAKQQQQYDDDWLNFNIMEELDFINFDEFGR